MEGNEIPTLVTPEVTLPGQRSEVPYFTRFIPTWTTPSLSAERWRAAVHNQPIAMICRETLIETMQSTPWRIVAKDPSASSPKEVDYYTELFTNIDGGWDLHIDLLMQDALDTPFGGIDEVGREGDALDGKVDWVTHIDAATVYPTYDLNYPVVQMGFGVKSVYFPTHAVNRLYYSPHPELIRKGWGMAPPERIYLALELLFRGDRWYANLLLDTPEAGVLDLGDISRSTAEEWLTSWRDLLAGQSTLKVPVLYEHTIAAKFIPFGRSPAEMSYPTATLRYMQIVCAGYGLSLADVGIMEGDTGTLAGAIRAERRSFRAGFGTARQKCVLYHNRLLPPYLRFEWVDSDDERLVAKGRARLANSMSLRNLVDGKILRPEDALEQLQSDGLITVSVVLPEQDVQQGGGDIVQHPTNIVSGELQKPVAPSKGGMGEVKKSFAAVLDTLDDSKLKRFASIARKTLGPTIENAQVALTSEELQVWTDEFTKFLAYQTSAFDSLEPAVLVRKTSHAKVLNELETLSLTLSVADLVEYYESTIKEVDRLIARSVYEDGGPVIEPPVEIRLSNGGVLSALAAFAEQLSSTATKNARELVARVVIRSLVEPIDVRTLITQGLWGICEETLESLDDWVGNSVLDQVVPIKGQVPQVLWMGE